MAQHRTAVEPEPWAAQISEHKVPPRMDAQTGAIDDNKSVAQAAPQAPTPTSAVIAKNDDDDDKATNLHLLG